VLIFPLPIRNISNMPSSRHLAFLVVAILCLQPAGRVHAGVTVGLNLDYPILNSGNQNGPVPTVNATPGSIVELSLFMTGSNLSTPVSSFAFSYSYPDLTDPSFQSQLPPGWTYTLGSNFFSAENESGANLTPANFKTNLGHFFFTISSNVPIGTSFDLGQTNLTNLAGGTAGGAPLNGAASDIVIVRVNVVPEPSAFWLLTSSLLLSGLGICRARVSAQRCS
jgi:hypothetical protein